MDYQAGKRSKRKIAADRRRIFKIAAIAMLAVITASLIASWFNSDSKTASAPAQNEAVPLPQSNTADQALPLPAPTPAPAPAVPPQRPASERYDYNQAVTGNPENITIPSAAPSAVPAAPAAPAQPTNPDQGNSSGTPEPAANQPAPPPKPAAVPAASSSYTLYCDRFSALSEAQAQKAKIAFMGIVAEVTRYSGRITLKIGPFKNRETAKAKFNLLGNQGLVGTCDLVSR